LKSNSAFLFTTHVISNDILKVFQSIAQGSDGLGDAYILYNYKNAGIPPELENYKYFCFNENNFESLNYRLVHDKKSRAFVSTINDFKYNLYPLDILLFYIENPDYDYYWNIEYDVRYSGDWKHLFQHFNKDRDLITTNLTHYKDSPDWHYWYLDHPSKSIPNNERVRSFNTIMRISKKALSFMHDCLMDGWFGHYEVIFSSLLYNNGFSIEDIGGSGDFCEEENINRFYTSSPINKYGKLDSGTMRFRPPHIYYLNEKNKLYHPVKPLLKFYYYRFGIAIKKRLLSYIKS